jgi:peroxiredoxin
MRERAPVVLVMLRGYPGYQCPMCTRQVADLRAQAGEIRKAGAEVLLVYPGPAARAKELLGASPLPEGFTLVMDPEYRFTNAYRLRWDAPNETAYPATFIVDRAGKIRFARVSRSHGGRVPAAEVVRALAAMK